jgi:hypothetical protein
MFNNQHFWPGLLFFTFLSISLQVSAQEPEDTIPKVNTTIILNKDTALRISSQSKAIDTSFKKAKSRAGKAALRSGIIPGWGQAYNKKYWKVPIVWGALAVPVVTFTYNLKWYDKTSYAYTVKYTKDTANYSNIDPELQPLSEESLQIYRNDFRRNMDYSILAFIIIWGLNVADAAVDAHLADFNVGEDLSLKIRPGHSQMGNTTGISVILAFRNSGPSSARIVR